MKQNKKSLLKLKLETVSKLNLQALTGRGDGVGKTITKSAVKACLSYLDQDEICKR